MVSIFHVHKTLNVQIEVCENCGAISDLLSIPPGLMMTEVIELRPVANGVAIGADATP